MISFLKVKKNERFYFRTWLKKQVLEIYEWDGYWYLASAKSLWNINQFNSEDFEIYKGNKKAGEYDLEYKF